MNYCEIKECDVANGLGVRVSLFVSGCRNHCKGCFQPETWDFNYGQEFTEEVKEKIFSMCDRWYISGLSILGGDPMEFENQEALVCFVDEFKKRFPEKNIWMYTGYVFEEILKFRMLNNVTYRLLSCVDVLVDGPFVESRKNLALRFRGSENQRIIDVKKTFEAGRVILYDCNVIEKKCGYLMYT